MRGFGNESSRTEHAFHVYKSHITPWALRIEIVHAVTETKETV